MVRVLPTKIQSAALDLETLGHRVVGDCFVTFAGGTESEEQYLNFVCSETYDGVVAEFVRRHLIWKAEGAFALVEDSRLLSDNPKYIFKFDDPFHHFIIDTVVRAFKIVDANPRAEIVFFIDHMDPKDFRYTDRMKQLKFLAKIFELNNVTYSFIDITDGVLPTYRPKPIYKIKNPVFVTVHSIAVPTSFNDVDRILEKYVLDKIPLVGDGGRKVYLSRGSLKQPANPLIEVEDGSPYKDNIRIYNESLIEEFLKERGFEIFHAEDLTNIEDQIEYFKSVSVLVGVSGSGLLNLLFMKSGGTVIELLVEDVLPGAKSYSIFFEYVGYSYTKSHMHISLDVWDKEGSTAVKKLDDLFKSLTI